MVDITGKRVAIVVDNFFEEAELTAPYYALKNAGATVDVIGVQAGTLQSMQQTQQSRTYEAQKSIENVNIKDYDALVLPGGSVNADSLRMDQRVIDWVKHFMDRQLPIAAICHAPWALASAGVIEGRKLTSYTTIQNDLRNAGAEWLDEEVVIDGNLITSRQADDVLAFNQALITTLQTK